MLSELYSDQRNHDYQGPSRAVSHPRACTVGGGTLATSQDGSRCVVAGKDVLRILRVLDPLGSNNGPSSKVQSQHNVASEPSPRVWTGPGGATIEVGSNLWAFSGLKMDSAPTDVVWARGNFDNKIVTSARNGEIIYWDINKAGSKCEIRVKEHKRAVNKLAISPCLPYFIVSGSQDGYLRVWDLRTPPSSNMKIYHPTAIRALALCPVPSNPLTVCTGLESGNIQRWDIRNKASPLERITLAHSSSILAMDWQLPSMREGGLGWLVTSGMDRRVKVWDLCLPHGIPIPLNGGDREAMFLNKRMGPRPFRTLHTAFPVRNVCWRPGYDCEVAVVSNNESESETVEVWDIRRRWIAKWALSGAEGGITDIAFAGSHALWALHSNGTFAQHDLRDSFRPLDAIPRVAMSWEASGKLAFVANKQPAVEVPFDDVDPSKNYILRDLRIRRKGTSDPSYFPFQQTLGVQHMPLFDHAVFARLAKSYVFDGDRVWVCQTNAEVASEAGQHCAAQIWLLLLSQLTDLQTPPSPPSVASPALTSQKDAARSSFSLSAASGASPSFSESCSVKSSQVSSTRKLTQTSSRAASPTPPDRAAQSRYRQDTPPSSGSSSPAPRRVSLQAEPLKRLSAPATPLHDPSVASPRIAAARRASTVIPMTPRPSRPVMRRASMSTSRVGSGSPASDGNRGPKHSHVGEGALDDSDSGSGSEPSASSSSDGAIAKVPEPVTRVTRGPKVLPSPLSRLLVSREDSPDGHLAGDEDSDVSHSPQSTSSSSGPPPRKQTSTWSSHRGVIASHRALAKQDSQSSIRTVTASSDPPSARPRVIPEEEGRVASLSSEDISTRRPSPTPGLGLGLSNVDGRPEGAQTSGQPDNPMTEARRDEVRVAEERFRDIAWHVLRDAVEWLAEKGDIQMCALLAILVPTELGISMGRAARFVEAYIDLLSRMQLHMVATDLRKYTKYPSVQNTTQVQTTLYTSCGNCRKPTRSGSGAALCHECRASPALCAVCHLPSRTLLLHCAICGHSAHLACLRAFYLARPLTTLSTSTHATENSSDSGSGSVSTTYYSLSEASEGTETEEEEEDRSSRDGQGGNETGDVRGARTRRGMRVMGHACAAGCGHYCWAASRPP